MHETITKKSMADNGWETARIASDSVSRLRNLPAIWKLSPGGKIMTV